ncbi:uncharacterized protein LOC111831039 [Capsella rubella]|uniref:uncharacterized protein LOC111831039 n=1 Tax=Capsella rubella TaxID=81985 RepID=UPI000CD51C67|nr:uncharacterized protein LOC111831039 [Capsella rubella]
MAAEQAMRYPPRLYEEGMSSLKNKSMCTYFRMADFPGVRESIGQDAWDEIKQLPLGIVAKLVESKFVWFAKTVHYLLCNQLRIKHKELWCLVGGQPIRFGLNEFAHLTGLNIDPTPSEKFEPSVDFKKFLTEELKVPGGEGPTYDELLKGLLVCRSWSVEKRKWLGLLIFLAIGLYCVHHNSRIPFEAAKIVSGDKAVKAYPWGRVAFETMVDNVKCLNPRGSLYTLGGPVYVLQAWAYDSIKCLGERFGNLVENEEIPLFRWLGTRTRSALDEAIAEDIKKYSETEEDPELVNLVNDIHEEKLVKGFWDVKVNEDKKKSGKVRAAVESESPAKKQKVEKGGDSGAEDAQKKKKINEEVKPHEQKNKQKKSEEVKADSEEDDAGGMASLKLLVGMVSEMKSSIETMKSKVETFDDKFTRVDEEFVNMKGLISFVARGGGLAGLMSGGKNIQNDDKLPLKSISNIRIRDAFGKKKEQTPEIQKKPSSQDYSVTSPPDFDEATNKKDGLLDFIEKSPSPANKKTRPVTRNLEAQQRKEAEAQKKKEELKKRDRKPRAVQQLKPSVPSDLVEELAEDVVKIPLVKFKLSKVEVEDNKGDRKGDNKGVNKGDNKGDNKASDNEIEDITDNNPFENFNILPESDIDEEENIRNERIKGLRLANVKFAKDGSALEPQPNPHVFPIIGENGLTCMRKNCAPSVAIYDPFAPVDPARLERLLEHLSPHKATPYGKAVPEVEFYKRIITERKDWPDSDTKYGWQWDDRPNESHFFKWVDEASVEEIKMVDAKISFHVK